MVKMGNFIHVYFTTIKTDTLEKDWPDFLSKNQELSLLHRTFMESTQWEVIIKTQKSYHDKREWTNSVLYFVLLSDLYFDNPRSEVKICAKLLQ